MPQLQLPIFLEGVTEVTANVAYEKQDGQVVYYVGMVPIFMPVALLIDGYSAEFSPKPMRLSARSGG